MPELNFKGKEFVYNHHLADRYLFKRKIP